jgi:hypothetical protein
MDVVLDSVRKSLVTPSYVFNVRILVTHIVHYRLL